jgi:Golgi nucleoside diphosphatase
VGTGDWNACYVSVSEFTRAREKFSICENERLQSCPDAEIKVPPIQFGETEFYAFSEFWYSTEDVLKMGGKYVPGKFRAASKVGQRFLPP